jgi:hypothetical protein
MTMRRAGAKRGQDGRYARRLTLAGRALLATHAAVSRRTGRASRRTLGPSRTALLNCRIANTCSRARQFDEHLPRFGNFRQPKNAEFRLGGKGQQPNSAINCRFGLVGRGPKRGRAVAEPRRVVLPPRHKRGSAAVECPMLTQFIRVSSVVAYTSSYRLAACSL